MRLWPFFKKPEAKAAPPAERKNNALFAMMLMGGGASDAPVSPQEAYDFYDSVAPLATVVDKIVAAGRSVFPVLSDGTQIIREHPFLDLLANPGYGCSYEELFTEYATSYLLTANAFLSAAGSTSGQPMSLEAIRATEVTAQKNEADGRVASYKVKEREYIRRVDGGRWRFLSGSLAELIHQRGPLDSEGMMGRSPLSAVRLEIEQRLGTARHNKRLLENGARPGGAMAFEQSLTDDQFERLKEQANEGFSGDNIGKTMILEGKAQFFELAKSPKDMDHLNLMKVAEEAIARRYNVPLPLLVADQMTLANMQTAQLAFWSDCVLLFIESVFSTWTRGLLPRYVRSDGLFLTYDPGAIKALQLENVDQARQMQLSGAFSDNEIRKVMGYEPYPQGDAIYKPAGSVQVGQDAVRDDAPHKELFATFIAECKALGLSEAQAKELWDGGR